MLEHDLLAEEIKLPAISTTNDRFMLCGNQSMLLDCIQILNNKGFRKATSRQQGDFVIEQAFVEK